VRRESGLLSREIQYEDLFEPFIAIEEIVCRAFEALDDQFMGLCNNEQLPAAEREHLEKTLPRHNPSYF
jgi:hypothetical protein